ncbi:hypothetical protein QWY31_00680 [Cytophagales bacterium LB-30]|uniref:Uncharacterized protein n=1 Tax=Shiella aurantiaca TaxID=3058365 RepID=A0ABT8F181_9BACT|nr:hypothetical protein [Shiella aurantiaca]MDN4163991.1 hypothetical protein [Shiella aurantiaca]
MLALFIGNMIGPFVVFKIEQTFIRKSIKLQIKAGIPEDDLHEFTLSATAYKALDWVRPDKEFRLDDEMFDIVRAETLGNTIHLYCVNDTEEALLFAQLDEITQKKMEQESNAPNSPVAKVVKLLKLVYVSFDNKEVLTGLSENPKQRFSGVKPLYSSPFLRVPSPPPNTV